MQQKRLMLRKYIIYQESAFCMWDISAGCKDVFNVFSVCWVRRLTSLFMAGDAVEEARMGRSSKATAFMFNFMVMMQSTTSPDLFAVFSPVTRHRLRTEELSPEVTRNVLVSHLLRFTSPDVSSGWDLRQRETRGNQESQKNMKNGREKFTVRGSSVDWGKFLAEPQAATTLRPRRRLPSQAALRPTPTVSLLSLPGELAYSYFQSNLLFDSEWMSWLTLTFSSFASQISTHSGWNG